jgi:hypothetical protein
VSNPTLADFVMALATIEAFLLAKLDELKERFPSFASDLERVREYLRVNGRTLEVLAVVSQELQVLSAGEGPVVHDDVDLA